MALRRSQSQGSKKNPWRPLVFGAISIFGGAALFWVGRQQSKTARLVRSESKDPVVTITTTDSSAHIELENWRGAPIGEGEDSEDSYHSFDHRPPGNDPRDTLLAQYTIYPCPNDGIGTMVSGQDPRYFEVEEEEKPLYKERNPKFLCDVAKLATDPIQPCVVYSFGSWDEISFEVGMNKVTGNQCEIHTFDPAKLPSPETASRNHFTAHDMGIGDADNGKIKTVSTIMAELGHSHLHVLKIDVEGHEKESLPALVRDGTLDHVDQLSFEFHSVELMKEGLDILVQAGFGIVFARREDRCGWCTEVSMVKIR